VKKVKKMKNKASALVSFVIPAYNSERTIEKCVESVLSQGVRKEVIVIDDGSTDGTGKVLRKFGGKITLMKQKNAGPAAARNAGMEKARGNYIAFVDADVALPRDWARNAMAAMDKWKASGAGGPGISPEKNAVSQALNLLLYGKSGTSEGYAKALATMDVMYRRDALLGMKFDVSFTSSAGEDEDLNFRLAEKGHRVLFSSKLSVSHDHPTTLGGIMRKWYNYGRHYPLLYSKHKKLRGKEYYARVCYFPLLITLIALSLLSPVFASLAILQVGMLFVSYVALGAEAGAGNGTFSFAFVHTLKQLAQLFGVMVGLRKIM
jgi:glycosyltransferase involved in cell wall biosynthesis